MSDAVKDPVFAFETYVPPAPAPEPTPEPEPVIEIKPEPTRLERLADVELPLTELSSEVLMHLRRPFAPEAVKYKVQTEWGGGALIVSYIDARLVLERLNLVWPWWRERKEPAGQGALRCTLELYDPLTGGVMGPRTDIGTGGDEKTRESDALKRAGVHFGIGVSIYALKQIKLKVGHGDAELRTEEKNKKNKRTNQWEKVQVPMIDSRTEDRLRLGYTRWLEVTGIPLFGPVLEHGDELGAQGLDTDSPMAAAASDGGDPVADTQEAGPEPLKDERAVELRTQAEGFYGQLRKLAPRKLTPAAFHAQLLAAAGAHETLEAFVSEIEQLVLAAGGDGGGADA